jgi:hypothetical protein
VLVTAKASHANATESPPLEEGVLLAGALAPPAPTVIVYSTPVSISTSETLQQRNENLIPPAPAPPPPLLPS